MFEYSMLTFLNLILTKKNYVKFTAEFYKMKLKILQMLNLSQSF